jgi:hypothetical protein
MGVDLSFPECMKYNDQDCHEFELKEIETDKVEEFMTIANEQNTPTGLQDFYGLWYMNGNPLADEVVSVAGSTFDKDKNSYSLKVYNEKVWTWSPTIAGRMLYAAVRQTGLTYKIIKSNDDTYNVTPMIHVPAYLSGLELSIPNVIVDFEIKRTEDVDVWSRPSK